MTKVSKTILADIYREVSGDETAPASKSDEQRRERISEFLQSNPDEEFIYDLRQMNGRPGDLKINAHPLFI